MKKHVAVLYGGMSAEREVSLTSGQAVIASLNRNGYRVTPIDVQQDVASVLQRTKPDVAFNALHGTYGEDGCIQGVLEILKIPYTHSGVMASALAMDKQKAKYIFQCGGLRVPPGKILSRHEILQGPCMDMPYVIKPINNGSSVGVVIVQDIKKRITGNDLVADEQFLVERYIPGKELSIAVLEEGPLGVIELQPHKGFYDYKNKYTEGKTIHIMPANIPSSIYEEAMAMSFTAHNLLGCSGVTRTDMRYDDKGDGLLYLLEINTQPGLTPLSLVPDIASYKQINFDGLVEYLIQKARYQK